MIDVGHGHRKVSFGAPSEAKQIADDLERYQDDGLQAFDDLNGLEILEKRHVMKAAIDDGLTPAEIAEVLSLNEITVKFGLAHHNLGGYDATDAPPVAPWIRARGVHPRHVYRAPRRGEHAKRPSSWQ